MPYGSSKCSGLYGGGVCRQQHAGWKRCAPAMAGRGGESLPASASDAVQQARQENDDAREKQKPVSEAQAAYITKQLNEIMRRIDVNLNFQYHKEVNVMSVRMLDKKTGELLREIPAASMIDHMIKARDWIGAFLDKMA